MAPVELRERCAVEQAIGAPRAGTACGTAGGARRGARARPRRSGRRRGCRRRRAPSRSGSGGGGRRRAPPRGARPAPAPAASAAPTACRSRRPARWRRPPSGGSRGRTSRVARPAPRRPRAAGRRCGRARSRSAPRRGSGRGRGRSARLPRRRARKGRRGRPRGRGRAAGEQAVARERGLRFEGRRALDDRAAAGCARQQQHELDLRGELVLAALAARDALQDRARDGGLVGPQARHARGRDCGPGRRGHPATSRLTTSPTAAAMTARKSTVMRPRSSPSSRSRRSSRPTRSCAGGCAVRPRGAAPGRAWPPHGGGQAVVWVATSTHRRLPAPRRTLRARWRRLR